MVKKRTFLFRSLILLGPVISIFYPGYAIGGAIILWVVGWLYGGGVSGGTNNSKSDPRLLININDDDFSSHNPYVKRSSDKELGSGKDNITFTKKMFGTDYDITVSLFIIGLIWMVSGIIFTFFITI
ncbi:MAG: hypothetical protein ACQESD_01740 [Thermoplasmatota archaeon]